MKQVKNLLSRIKRNKRGQIFLVCTVVIIIYMLSFITVIYELNVTQFAKNEEIAEFETAFENFKLETTSFMKGLLANYSNPVSVITDNVIAGQILDGWLSFAENQMFLKGYFAVFDINDINPTTPIDIVQANGLLSLEAYIDVYMECNYISIDTEFQYNYQYTLSYSNTATTALIEFTFDSGTATNYIGNAIVTVNTLSTTNFYNGSYLYSTPLVATDVVEGTTVENIIVTLTV